MNLLYFPVSIDEFVTLSHKKSSFINGIKERLWWKEQRQTTTNHNVVECLPSNSYVFIIIAIWILFCSCERKSGVNALNENIPTLSLRSTHSEKAFTSKKRVIRMLIVVVAIFFCCWTPSYIWWLLLMLGDSFQVIFIKRNY